MQYVFAITKIVMPMYISTQPKDRTRTNVLSLAASCKPAYPGARPPPFLAQLPVTAGVAIAVANSLCWSSGRCRQSAETARHGRATCIPDQHQVLPKDLSLPHCSYGGCNVHSRAHQWDRDATPTEPCSASDATSSKKRSPHALDRPPPAQA